MFILEICNNQTFKNIHESAKINPVLAATDAKMAYKYAINIIGGRFELGEKAIAKDAQYSYMYAIKILKKPFPLGEPAIAKDAYYSYYYANVILKNRFALVNL